MASAGGTSTTNPAARSTARCCALTPSQSHTGTATIQNAAPTQNAATRTSATNSAKNASTARAAYTPACVPCSLHRRAHSRPPIATTSAIRNAMPSRGRRNSAATSSVISTAAVPTRFSSSGNAGALRLLELLAGAAEAPLARAVGSDRRVERRGVEVRPERFGEVELAVGELPEKEVADALLTAGADEKIGLGRVAHREIGRQCGLFDRFQLWIVLQKPRHGLQDVPAAAVVRRDREREALIAGGQSLALLDQRADLGGEALRVADHLEAHAAGEQLGGLVLQSGADQLHQQPHFLGRTAPVLGADGEQREVGNAAVDAGAYRGAHRLRAAPVAGDARQAPAARPAAVAVHDDGDVTRHRAMRRDLEGRARRGARFAHTAISSFSFSCSSLSMSAIW